MGSFNLGVEMLAKLCEDAWNGADLSDRFLLFLDFDGVLNHKNTKTKTIEGFVGLDRTIIARFNALVEKTKPLIVVSSSWRIGETIDSLRSILCDDWGFKFPDLIIGRTTSALSVGGRGAEIDEWLKKFPGKPPKAFVILDDDSFDIAPHLDRLVHTSWNTGLLEEHVTQVFEKFGITQ